MVWNSTFSLPLWLIVLQMNFENKLKEKEIILNQLYENLE